MPYPSREGFQVKIISRAIARKRIPGSIRAKKWSCLPSPQLDGHLPGEGSLSLGSIDILDWIILCWGRGEAVLYIVRCLRHPWSPPRRYEEHLPPGHDNQRGVSRHWPTPQPSCPGCGNCPGDSPCSQTSISTTQSVVECSVVYLLPCFPCKIIS